jgi:hypothetical protein
MRIVLLVICGVWAVLSAPAATLEKLSMDDMIVKSTSIVRGRVGLCAGEFRGSVIYTRCRVAVTESWKGSQGSHVEVWLPGGSARGLTQTFSGTPRFTEGEEFVLFLWAGKSGMLQVIGLSQGAFSLKADSKGALTAQREATSELMVDGSGHPVEDEAVRVRVRDLKERVTRTLAGGKVQ